MKMKAPKTEAGTEKSPAATASALQVVLSIFKFIWSRRKKIKEELVVATNELKEEYKQVEENHDKDKDKPVTDKLNNRFK